MKHKGSLIGRVILGSLLWTAGLLMLAHMATVVLMTHSRIFRFTTHTMTLATPVAVLLLIVGLAGLRSGLSPLPVLRRKLAEMREGKAQRVDGDYPAEVQPLVSDLNALLEQRERTVQRALATAGDLAHGLKTPLAVLSQEAERAAAQGHAELAKALQEQVDRMRRQVDYHLARARAAASGASLGVTCVVAETAEAIRRTLLRLHAARGIEIHVRVPAELMAQCQKEDLEEILGNLMDNGCKWARGVVEVSAEARNGGVKIHVDDDGEGVPAQMREAVLRRGVRADEQAPGSGLGLAIVAELAGVYGGWLRLEESRMGGLRAVVWIPGPGSQ